MRSDVRALVALLWPYRWRYAAGAACLAVADFGQLLATYLVGDAIDALEGRAIAMSTVRGYAGLIVLTSLAVVVARWGWRQMIFGSSRMIERGIRQRLYDHLQKLSARFFLDRKIGELMAYATNDIPAIQQAAAGGMMQLLDGILVLVGAAGFMIFTVDWRLSLVALAPLILLNPLVYVLGKRLHAAYFKVQGAFAELSDRVQEALAGMRVVKGFVREEWQARYFLEANRAYQSLFGRMLRYDVSFDPVIGVLAGISLAIGLLYGGRLVVEGRVTLGEYVAFNNYLRQLIWPMMALGFLMNHIQRASASMRRLDALFAEAPEIVDRPGAVPLPSPRGALRVSGLTFRYRSDLPPALSDISFEVAPGGTLGILGRTGSGKSTLANLLVRVFDPPAGAVSLDGHDVLDLRVADLRAAVAYVPQDAFLFSRSIRDNIAFDAVDAPDARVEAAARLADVHDDVLAFQDGYDTLLGERGVTLSGGQRQRVCLARALVRDAPVLVLDDCLSAVDTATEARILAALRPTIQDRTSIVISHRVSALRDADEIVVLDGGRVVERGGHDELIAADGEYARLWRRQQLLEAIEAPTDGA